MSKKWKKIFAKKKPYKTKKIHQQNNFLFKFYIWIWKFCRNQLDLDTDVANLLFWDYLLKNWQHALCSKNTCQKNKSSAKSFTFWFYNSMRKFVPNWLIGYMDTNFLGKCMFNYICMTNMKFIRKVWPIWKKVHQQSNFSCWFYISIPNFV